MKQGILSFFFLFLLIQVCRADVAIIALNSDAPDDLAFVVTAVGGIASGTTLFFTDNEYSNGTNTFSTGTGDGVIQLVTNTYLPQGTVVLLNTTAATNANGGTSVGTVTEPDSGFNPSNAGEPIYAYTTADNTATGTVNNICASFTNDGYDTGAEDPSATYPNTIVIDLAITPNTTNDNAAYDPASGTTFASVADFITALQNPVNYQNQDDPPYNLATLYNGLSFNLAPVAVAVPSIGEWGLIILSILLLTFGMIQLHAKEMAVAGTRYGTMVSGGDKRLPFFATIYKQSLKWVSILAAIIGSSSFIVYGEMTLVDLCGGLATIPLVAYLLHLVLKMEDRGR